MRTCLLEANLREANLQAADLRDADLRNADLREANLRGANLYWADARKANIGWSDLRGANLCNAILSEADFRGANLYGVSFGGADLYDADFGEAKFGRIILPSMCVPVRIDSTVYRAWRIGPILSYGCEAHPIATWPLEEAEKRHPNEYAAHAEVRKIVKSLQGGGEK